MIERPNTPYDEPISTGDIVYYADCDTRRVVKMGIVARIDPRDRYRENLHILGLDPVTKRPLPESLFSGLTSRSVFTKEQVLAEMVFGDSPLSEDLRTLDEIVVDTVANRELAALLGATVMERVASNNLFSVGQFEHQT